MEDTIAAFVQQQKEWLQAELQSDDNESVRVLNQLEALDISVGLFGRTVVSLGLEDQPLPAHKFTNGDEVDVKYKNSFLNGVVSRVTDEAITVALQKPDEEGILEQSPLTLLPTSSTVVHAKMIKALDELQKEGLSHPNASRVIEQLFSSQVYPSTTPLPSFAPTNSKLDETQIQAVQLALSDNPITLIHGPPGTGKTTTLVEYITHQVKTFNSKMLVCAPSNVAVDNLLERLKDVRCVRLGHPARLSESIMQHSLEALVNRADGTEIVHDVRQELQGLLRMLPKTKDKRTIYREAKVLRKEIKTRQEKVVEELLNNAQVVLATCVGAANHLLRDRVFDVVVIDEAAQALEAACWIPTLLGKRLVLAGDHKQLPPTIKCNDPKVSKGLEQTMFERLMDMDTNESVSRMLQIQYRMHQVISDWASQALYKGRLRTHESVASRTLAQLTDREDAEAPMLLIDTAGCDMYEKVNLAGSRYNEGEASIVKQHVERLLELGVRPQDIAIISPYNGQVEILKLALLPIAPKVEIRSVDGFQGGERVAVVLSLVRSSEKGGIDGIGFLKDDRRLNVAVTRAKRHVCLICDSETVSQSSFVDNLVSWMSENGETRSAFEYVSSEDQIEGDLALAERELERLKLDERKRDIAKSNDRKKLQKKEEDEERRKELEKMLKGFQMTKKPGEKMALSPDLTSYDRRMIHEIAEKLGIGHASEGTEGVDRRIVISLPQAPKEKDGEPEVAREDSSSSDSLSQSLTSEEVEVTPDEALEPGVFSSLVEQSDSESEGDNDESKDEAPSKAPASSNNLLANLAKEREQREIAKLKEKLKPEALKAGTSQKNKKAPKSQKLGGSKQARPEKDEIDESLDDMAFLDAQIEKVQTSHGRRVEGKGSHYRTIINGVLTQKPRSEPERKPDPKKSAALQSKLKKAQDARKAKSKKK